jgi:hypothetical protein
VPVPVAIDYIAVHLSFPYCVEAVRFRAFYIDAHLTDGHHYAVNVNSLLVFQNLRRQMMEYEMSEKKQKKNKFSNFSIFKI